MKKRLFIVFLCLAFLALLAGGAWAAEYCVDPGGGGTHTDPHWALLAAQSNGEDDIIKVVQGTYNSTGSNYFYYYSSEGHSVDLRGGYTAGCASRVVAPANTILDAKGSSTVLFFQNGSGGNISVDGFTIQNGISASSGGGIFARSHSDSGAPVDITITNNIITGNSAAATCQGGGVYAMSYADSSSPGGSVTLTNNTVTGNTADYDGGGAYAGSFSTSGTGGTVTLTNNTITGNTTTHSNGHGGGVYATSYSGSAAAGTVSLTGNTITGNTGGGDGGGVGAWISGSSGGGTITITSNTVTGNTTTHSNGHGGGVYAYAQEGSGSGTAGDVILTNNIIAGNNAPGTVAYGGGVEAMSYSTSGTKGDVTATNNTIVGNSSGHYGGGAVFDGNTGRVYNNIIRGNTATTTAGDIYLASLATADGYNNDYHEINGTWTNSNGNIDADPVFVGTGDYHLQRTSPCVDTGINTAPSLPATDFDGDPRIIGSAPDIGADEYVPSGYVILHRDGALWSSATGWLLTTPPYYPGTAYAKAFKLWENGIYLILHKDGAYFLGLGGLGLWNTNAPPYYPGTAWAVDILPGVILHKDGALWYSDTGWVLTAPPYYPGTAYAKDLEVRSDNSYVILHKDGAIYDSASGWVVTAPPYYPGTSWAVDMKLEEGGYKILHRDGAVYDSVSGWITTTPPYYPGTAYAKALELVVDRYVILHKDGAIYNSATGWLTTAPPYYPGTDYAEDLELQ